MSGHLSAKGIEMTLERPTEDAAAQDAPNTRYGWLDGIVDRRENEIEALWRASARGAYMSGTAPALALAAHAMSNLGFQLWQWGRPRQEITAAYRAAVEAGREAGTRIGLLIAARAGVAIALVLEGRESLEKPPALPTDMFDDSPDDVLAAPDSDPAHEMSDGADLDTPAPD